MTDEADQRVRDIQREYLDFLDDAQDQGIYSQKVHDMIASNEMRIIVNINDLRKKNPKRALGLLNGAFEEMIAFHNSLKEIVSAADPIYSKQYNEFYVGFEGSFGVNHVTPRTLTSTYLGRLVCVEGIVTKCSMVHPKVVRSVHYCPETKKTLERRYTDMTSMDAFPSSAAYPTKDDDGNILETEFGLSSYKDHQTFSIQEMPEKYPAGQIPRSVDIIVDNDLVDSCKPGDRVQVIGLFRCLPSKRNGFTTATFRTILIANNVKQMNKELTLEFTAEDILRMKKLSRRKIDVYDLLSRSLAPSIHGHEFIKKAILCLLLGGNEKLLPNGSRIRGDINIMLIGDPSVAKSQLLRYVLHSAPRAIATTGRGSSGVGLTAAVTTDQESGERRLEAGAMVLADRGVVCIDEFDKMSDIDRTAIHEVMEQGRVTIAKAGIHAKLNARCSVLAAANPVYGRYDEFKTPMENIGLQDSLLSRFDLLFIVLDKIDIDQDKQISDHVLRMHRYRTPGEREGEVLPNVNAIEMLTTNDPDKLSDETHDTPVFEKYDALLHGGSRSSSDEFISKEFMKKYIHVARKIQPALTLSAATFISEKYTKLRSQESLQGDNIARTQPVTPRTLETLIRLATAHAKSRMSKTVEVKDAEAAMDLVHFGYFKKVLQRDGKKRHRSDDEDEDESANEKPSRSRRMKRDGDRYDPYDFDEEQSEEGENPSLQERRSSRSQPSTPSSQQEVHDSLDEDKMKLFRASLFNHFKTEHSQSSSVDAIIAHIQSEHSDVFSDQDIHSALDAMMESNQVMVSDKFVFLI